MDTRGTLDMSTPNQKWLAEIAIAIAIIVINIWMTNHLVDHGQYSLHIAQAWSGLAVLLALAYAAGVWPRKTSPAEKLPSASPLLASWLTVAVWVNVCCTFPWVSLPGGGALGLPAAVLFIGLIWQRGRFGLPVATVRAGILLGLFGFALLLALFFNHSPFRQARLIADFSGQLDLQGRHYFHGMALQVLSGVQAFGESTRPLPNHFDRVKTFDFLRLAHSIGAIPAVLLAAALVIFWQRVFAWLRGVSPGTLLSIEGQRLGLALVILHGITTLLNILWNFAITRQAFGAGLPPLTSHAAWWILSGCLAWILLHAYRQNALAETTPSNLRYNWSMAGMLAGFAVTMSVGLLIAVDSAKDVYAANRTAESTQLVRRDITDQHGNIIATSAPAYDLWLLPDRFWSTSPANPRTDFALSANTTPDEHRRDQLLKSLGDWPQLRNIVDFRLRNYSKSESSPKILAWGIKPAIAAKIAAAGLAGLKLTARPIRDYPQGSLYAHALGFTSLAGPQHGQDGLELAANTELVRTVNNDEGSAAKPLPTTLDPDIQNAAAQALQEGVTKRGAIGGAAVVIDAETGKIRAMVSSPGFDANDDKTYRNPYQPERMLNRARGINFSVGSLLTPLLAAHMIETGRMTPSTKVAIGNKLTVGKQTVVDLSPAETLTLAEIVTKSSNIGQAKLALSLPITELRDVARNLGIGEPLYIGGLTGCIDYQSIMWSNWTPQMQAQPGLHINTNLLQAMRAYLPLANGGWLGRISLIEASALQPSAFAQVLSDTTVKAMRNILSAAAGPTGTAPLAQLSGVMVAGKMGTTVASNGHPVAAFVGMAPADKPRWLVGVLLEFPKAQTRLAGNTAAPVIAGILKGMITTQEKSP